MIGEHIEPQVVEIFGEGAADWAEREARPLCKRIEGVGETAFCYLDRAEQLVERLERNSQLRYIHRHGTLEDLFLKLTGRELRD